MTRLTDLGDIKKQQRISRGWGVEALQLCFGADTLPEGKIWGTVSQRVPLGGCQSPWTSGLCLDMLLSSVPRVSAYLWASLLALQSSSVQAFTTESMGKLHARCCAYPMSHSFGYSPTKIRYFCPSLPHLAASRLVILLCI